MSVFDSFVKTRDYLICVDSDGCVMDTMNCKHFHCFGPCLIAEWALEQWQEEILHRWNEINLFRMTRGINRFRALSIALAEISQKYTPIIGVDGLKRWVETSTVLSDDALQAAVASEQDDDTRLCLQKALSWSLAVNEEINLLHGELKKPFDGAAYGLMAAHTFADVAVISGANREAVEEEWGCFGLLEYTDIVLAQDIGSTAHCIRKMLEYGYDPHKVLLVGDDPGDSDAAKDCGIWFYPILVNWEEESWAAFRTEAMTSLRDGTYGLLQDEKRQVFEENLGA